MIKLLIVDDEIGIREAFSFCFQEMDDYQLFLASTGKEALEIVEREKPDIMLLDLFMPTMNGTEVLQRLKEQDSPVRVIIITGDANCEEAIKARELGALGFITKPFDLFQIEESLKRMVPELY